MRINQHKRIFMTEEGASPGGGAAPPAPEQPAAQPGSEPSQLDTIKSAMNEIIGGFRTEMTSWKNGIFADLRKSGALGKDKPTGEQTATTPPASQPNAPSAATGISMADVQAMLEKERVVTARATQHGLSDAQTRRMKAALADVSADSFATEADAYLADMGLVKAPAPSNPTPANPTVTPSTQPPVSDKGSPAPGGVVNWEAEFTRDPLRMSPAAKAAMAAKHGAEKARSMRLEAIKQRADQIPVVVTERH